VVEIIRGTTQNPDAVQRLVACFRTNLQDVSGLLYTGFPVIGTPEGPYSIDALFVSKKIGLVIIDLVEGSSIDGFEDQQDFGANALESKLRQHRELMHRRTFPIPIHTVTFAPAGPSLHRRAPEDYPICNEADLPSWIADLATWQAPQHYRNLLAVLQSVSDIRKSAEPRRTTRENSRGAKLRKLEDAIANWDSLQARAVIETVEGVQRIRGLAGSGKTIVLALKAAYWHAQHPDWKIVVTFNTRSLKALFRRLIERFTLEATGMAPDWSQIQVLHAWGAPGGGERQGVYHTFCRHVGTEYYDYGRARNTLDLDREFAGACEAALDVFAELEPKQKHRLARLDALLVDEAQDLPPAFLRICYELLKKEKRLVYAYDELQDLGPRPLPPAEEIFGTGADGAPRVRFDSAQEGEAVPDIVLKNCYRNSGPVLATAHALGFGIYRQKDQRTGTGLVQMFEPHQLWEEIGYQLVAGKLEDGEDLVLARTEAASPRFLQEHSEIDDLIQFRCFPDAAAQAQWVAEAIAKNLESDELKADDIVVINPDPLTTRQQVSPIRVLLFEMGIQSHTVGVETSPDVLFKKDVESVAFAGIYRAKGNEAGMVYVVNAQDCYDSKNNLVGVRNRLFTAMTRSKAWVRVLGIGPGMRSLLKEFQGVKEKDFRLAFRYPDARQKKSLKLVNRDMPVSESRRIQESKDSIRQLAQDLESGRVHPEDISGKDLEYLNKIVDIVKTNV